MDLCRGTQEVEAVLSEGTDSVIEGSRDLLARLKMAIRYQEKKVWYNLEMIDKKINFAFPTFTWDLAVARYYR